MIRRANKSDLSRIAEILEEEGTPEYIVKMER